jgi:Zn-dependent M32 family carboxypeptidase
MNENMNINMNEVNRSGMDNMNNEVVENIYAYQRALALTNVALNRFDSELKGKTNFTSALDEISKGLDQLTNAIENKESPTEVMEIVHGQIQTNLQTAFNLELAPPVNQDATGNVSRSIDNMNNSTSIHMMMNMR